MYIFIHGCHDGGVGGDILVKSSNRPRVFLPILSLSILFIPFAFPKRPAYP